ncbi:ABC transporter substrate-binding protein [Microbacterium horticulturae]|uniref:ABC transporter substrate-binding protein n=1 Tax=Microbacterium horticulturae TaxID=3028316 RepID=A0ABY8BWB0_9MICO|nr:ABC transporter substrate-binding protein [Microbacterium sp. KACC 23027]WEG08468.1 ABC transporter substrate-binding protein [Microbacterium sp. KACC 23027]
MVKLSALARGAALAVATVLFAGTVTACSTEGATSPEATGSRGDVLTIAVRQPESLNPALVDKMNVLPRLAYQSLLGVDDDGGYVGVLAESFAWEGDTFTSLKIDLKTGLTFSDGDALNADAVVKSFTYFQSAKGPTSALYSDVSVEKVDDMSVRFISKTPNPDLEFLLTDVDYGGTVISPTGVDHPDSLETESHGIGPYVYGDVKTGVTYTLKANPDFYDQSAIHFKSIDFPVLATEAAQTQAIMGAQADMTFSTVSASWADTVAANPDLSITVAGPAWNGLELLDTQGKVVPALADQRVRQAIMYAVDRKAITAAVYGPDAQARVQAANSTWLGFDKGLESTYPYDPDRARQLLDEAGYSDIVIPVAITAGDVGETLLQAMSGYLEKVGITLDIKTATDVGAVIGLVYSGTVAGMALPNAQRSVYQFLSDFFLPDSGLNPMKQEHPELQALLDTALHSNSQADWAAIIRYLNDQALTIPISNAPDIWISRSTVDLSRAYNAKAGVFDLTKVTAAR